MLALTLLVLSQSPLAWSSPTAVSSGGNVSFVLSGTRRGQTYVLRARGVCTHRPEWVWRGAWVDRRRRGSIFGADFRASFGDPSERRILNLGENTAEATELTFTALTDDVVLRIWDDWVMPPAVQCVVDGLEVQRVVP